MVSSADEKGLRHNPRHKKRDKRITLSGAMARTREQLEAAREEAIRSNPELWFLRKWGCWREEVLEDPRTGDILKRLYKVWPRLSADQRRVYLQAAESIAEAEKSKSTLNPRGTRERYMRLSKSAIAAAKLVQELSLIFPPPWAGEKAKIGELLFGLASFVSGARLATIPFEVDMTVDDASDLLRAAKKKIKRRVGGMRWELLRDLVWLASGRSRELDERTVRRYLDKQQTARNPVAAFWGQHSIEHVYWVAKEWRGQLREPHTSSQADSWPWNADLMDQSTDASVFGDLPDSHPYRQAGRQYLTTP
jgi:hypothetical protein